MANVDIVVVEDEGIVAMSFEVALQRLGYRVVGVADTAEAAVKLVREKRPGLVLMDIRIRGETDGVDAAREIALRYNVPVVFVTGNADDVTLMRALAAEPFGFVVKPVNVKELQVAIETALRRFEAEERIRNIERWLLTTLRSIADAVVVLDHAARVTFMNGSAEELCGWSATEALGRAVGEVLPLRAAEGLFTEAVARVVVDGKVVQLPALAVLTRRDGTEARVSGTASPILDDTEVGGAVVVLRRRDPRELERAVRN